MKEPAEADIPRPGVIYTPNAISPHERRAALSASTCQHTFRQPCRTARTTRREASPSQGDAYQFDTRHSPHSVAANSLLTYAHHVVRIRGSDMGRRTAALLALLSIAIVAALAPAASSAGRT